MRSVAGRLSPGGNLRHVDDRRYTRFFRGLSEIDGSADDAWRDGMKEIGRPDAFHGCADIVDVGEIADGNVDTAPAQVGRSLIVRPNVGPHALLHFEQFVDGGAAGSSGRATHKKLSFTHDSDPSKV